MASDVHTARLAAGDSGSIGVVHPVYTCPTGITTILKDIRVYSPFGDNSRVIVMAVSGGHEVSLLDQALGGAKHAGLECWVVLLPNDSLRVYSVEFRIKYWLSGTQLEGLSPVPPQVSGLPA